MFQRFLKRTYYKLVTPFNKKNIAPSKEEGKLPLINQRFEDDIVELTSFEKVAKSTEFQTLQKGISSETPMEITILHGELTKIVKQYVSLEDFAINLREKLLKPLYEKNNIIFNNVIRIDLSFESNIIRTKFSLSYKRVDNLSSKTQLLLKLENNNDKVKEIIQDMITSNNDDYVVKEVIWYILLDIRTKAITLNDPAILYQPKKQQKKISYLENPEAQLEIVIRKLIKEDIDRLILLLNPLPNLKEDIAKLGNNQDINQYMRLLKLTLDKILPEKFIINLQELLVQAGTLNNNSLLENIINQSYDELTNSNPIHLKKEELSAFFKENEEKKIKNIIQNIINKNNKTIDTIKTILYVIRIRIVILNNMTILDKLKCESQKLEDSEQNMVNSNTLLDVNVNSAEFSPEDDEQNTDSNSASTDKIQFQNTEVIQHLEKFTSFFTIEGQIYNETLTILRNNFDKANDKEINLAYQKLLAFLVDNISLDNISDTNNITIIPHSNDEKDNINIKNIVTNICKEIISERKLGNILNEEKLVSLFVPGISIQNIIKEIFSSISHDGNQHNFPDENTAKSAITEAIKDILYKVRCRFFGIEETEIINRSEVAIIMTEDLAPKSYTNSKNDEVELKTHKEGITEPNNNNNILKRNNNMQANGNGTNTPTPTTTTTTSTATVNPTAQNNNTNTPAVDASKAPQIPNTPVPTTTTTTSTATVDPTAQNNDTNTPIPPVVDASKAPQIPNTPTPPAVDASKAPQIPNTPIPPVVDASKAPQIPNTPTPPAVDASKAPQIPTKADDQEVSKEKEKSEWWKTALKVVLGIVAIGILFGIVAVLGVKFSPRFRETTFGKYVANYAGKVIPSLNKPTTPSAPIISTNPISVIPKVSGAGHSI